MALLIHARCTEIMGIDIHPGATIGGGLMIDHGSGVVIGETCVIGRNCNFLHGITLGGTGNTDSWDRHPKLGNNVFIGCNATVLGNISIGDEVIIGSGSLVLKPLPPRAVAIGTPAVIKRIKEKKSSVLTAIENTKHSTLREGSKNDRYTSVVTLWEKDELWEPQDSQASPKKCSDLLLAVGFADSHQTYFGDDCLVHDGVIENKSSSVSSTEECVMC